MHLKHNYEKVDKMSNTLSDITSVDFWTTDSHSLLSLLATDALHHDALFFIVNLTNEVAALKNFHSFVHYLSDLFLVET